MHLGALVSPPDSRPRRSSSGARVGGGRRLGAARAARRVRQRFDRRSPSRGLCPGILRGDAWHVSSPPVRRTCVPAGVLHRSREDPMLPARLEPTRRCPAGFPPACCREREKAAGSRSISALRPAERGREGAYRTRRLPAGQAAGTESTTKIRRGVSGARSPARGHGDRPRGCLARDPWVDRTAAIFLPFRSEFCRSRALPTERVRVRYPTRCHGMGSALALAQHGSKPCGVVGNALRDRDARSTILSCDP